MVLFPKSGFNQIHMEKLRLARGKKMPSRWAAAFKIAESRAIKESMSPREVRENKGMDRPPIDTDCLLSLPELADFLAATLDDEDPDKLAAMGPVEIIAMAYISGECDAFAEFLHRSTGWPVVALSSSSIGFVHRFVEAPDGRCIDAGGTGTRDTISARYGLRDAVFSKSGGLGLLMGEALNSEDDEDPDPEVRKYGPMHLVAAAVSLLPYDPFPDLARELGLPDGPTLANKGAAR
jgi:hypothetical protein